MFSLSPLEHSIFWDCLTVLISLLILKPLAQYLKLVDHPGGRKEHRKATPLIGGIALFNGFLVLFLQLHHPNPFILGLLTASFIIVCVGIQDDRHDIAPSFRLIFQIIAILCLALLGQTYLKYLGNILFIGDIHLGKLGGIAFSTFMLITYINAINMLDGLDGLASSLIFLQSILLLGVSLAFHDHLTTTLLISFLLMLSVFMTFNFPIIGRQQAWVFLGDSGSNFIAIFVAGVVMHMANTDISDSIRPLTFLWIITFPFLDITGVCLARKQRKKSCTLPGRDHIHHLLLDIGFSNVQVLFILCIASLSFGLFGFILAFFNIPESIQFVMLILSQVIYCVFRRQLNTVVDYKLSIHQPLPTN